MSVQFRNLFPRNRHISQGNAYMRDIIAELNVADDSLMLVLTFASSPLHQLSRVDRDTLFEIITQLRNYTDHIRELGE